MADQKQPRSDTAMPHGEIEQEMKTLRDRIDRLDEELIRLLNDRADCALRIGQLKEHVGMETYQPGREIEVLAHARAVNGGPLPGDAITRLFERIIDENRRLERLWDGKGTEADSRTR